MSVDRKCTVKIQNCIRLGKANNNKIRPVKIIFDNSQQALDVLRSYKRSGRLYLNRDLTPRQQNYCFEIRSEFRNRINLGEKDIFLRYRNGFPSIVKGTGKNL